MVLANTLIYRAPKKLVVEKLLVGCYVGIGLVQCPPD
jgi:hypothetical protein